MQIKDTDYVNSMYIKAENSIKQDDILNEENTDIQEVSNIDFKNNEKVLKKNKDNLILDDGIAYKNFLNKNKDTKAKDNVFMLKELKDTFGHISNTVKDKNIIEMLEKGLDPEKNPPFTMSNFISKSFGIDIENKEKETAQKAKQESNVKADLNMNGVDEEAIFNYEEILLKSGLPLTNKNIDSIKSLQNKFEKIDNINSNSTYNLLKKQGNITLEDIYTIKHSGNYKEELLNLDNINDIDEQISNILTSEEIPLQEENIDIAKDFIKNQVDITKENFEKYNKLNNIQNSFDISDILKKGAINIGLNKPISDINLFENLDESKLFKQYNQLMDILPNVKTESIQNLINNNVKLNLKNIQKEYNKKNAYENIEITEQALTERLNLAKIQMKLTTEAIYRLSSNGIDINIKPLQNVISTLENMEISIYKDALKISNVPINNENVSKIQGFFNTFSDIYPKLVYSTFKEIANNEIDFSIKGISTSIKSKNILETFETFKTVPDARFGDKISNLTKEFEKILDENGLETTKSNLKAAKILTLNNMEFNKQNLLNVKVIDAKIDYVYNNLHPIIASNMIKDGFNPLERKIDELIHYIDSFSNEFGQTSKEKIAEQILQLDNENILTKEERAAIISVYKMLNLIEKDNSGSIGTLLKSEKSVTLGNLLEASKAFKKSKTKKEFDFKIDNDTEIKVGASPEEGITNSIERVINKNLEYNSLILNQIINNLTPDKALEYTKNSNTSIEKIYEELKDNNSGVVSDNKLNNILQKSKNLENINQNTLDYIIKNNIPITINNISNVEAIINENLKNSNVIQDFEDELKNRDIKFGESILKVDEESQSFNQAISTLNEFEKENNDIFDDILNLEDLNDIKHMILKNKNVSSTIRFMKDLNTAENGIYNLPLRLSNGNITDFNMLVLNNKALNEKNVNLFLQFENNKNENIHTYVKVSENGDFANITAKNGSLLENIKNSEEDILTILKKFNIKPNKIKYSLDDDKNIFNLVDKTSILNKLENLDSEFEEIV